MPDRVRDRGGGIDPSRRDADTSFARRSSGRSRDGVEVRGILRRQGIAKRHLRFQSQCEIDRQSHHGAFSSEEKKIYIYVYIFVCVPSRPFADEDDVRDLGEERPPTFSLFSTIVRVSSPIVVFRRPPTHPSPPPPPPSLRLRPPPPPHPPPKQTRDRSVTPCGRYARARRRQTTAATAADPPVPVAAG